MRVIALDPLRFLAAISVVLFHYMYRPEADLPQGLSYAAGFGYLGVPLFFMISGYVIAFSAENKTAFEFAVARLTRLYPVFWAGMAFTLAFAFIFGKDAYPVEQVIANLTMLAPYLGHDYLDGVYWTLTAELKFYACVFFLMVLGWFNEYRIWLGAWLLLAFLHFFTGQPFFMGWFINPHYSPYFIAGIAFCLMQKKGAGRFISIVLLSSLLLSSFQAYSHAYQFLRWPGMLERSIAVLLVWSFYALFYLMATGKIKPKDSKKYLALGSLTYPLYLIHNVAGKAVIDGLNGVMPEGASVVATIGLMLFSAYAMHRVMDGMIAAPLKHQLLNMGTNVSRYIKNLYPT